MIDLLVPCRSDVILVQLPKREVKVSGFDIYEHDNDRSAMHPKYGLVLATDESEEEIKPGDTLYFSYLVLESAQSNSDSGLLIKEKDRWAVLMRREDAIFAIRDGNTILLNETCLVAPVDNEKKEIDGFKLSQKDSRQISAVEGVIRESKFLPNGSLILFEDNANTPVEYSLTAKLEPLYRMKEHEIIALIKHKLNNVN